MRRPIHVWGMLNANGSCLIRFEWVSTARSSSYVVPIPQQPSPAKNRRKFQRNSIWNLSLYKSNFPVGLWRHSKSSSRLRRRGKCWHIAGPCKTLYNNVSALDVLVVRTGTFICWKKGCNPITVWGLASATYTALSLSCLFVDGTTCS